MWREMQMQACAMRMLLAVYTDVRRRRANRSGVAQNIPLSAVVRLIETCQKKNRKAVNRGRSPASVQVPTGTTGDFDQSSNAKNEIVCLIVARRVGSKLRRCGEQRTRAGQGVEVVAHIETNTESQHRRRRRPETENNERSS